MATKTLIRLIIALAVLGGVAAILHFTRGGGAVSTVASSTTKKKVYDDFPINEVAKIVVREKENSVTLAKGEKSWEVAERDGYPANTEPVVGLLRKIWDLNIVQPISIGRTQYGRLSLLDPAVAETKADEAAILLVFQDKDGKDLATLWLGKVYARSEGRPDPFGGGMATTDAGRYVKRGDSNSVYLVGETFQDAKTDPTEWLDQSFFKVEKIKSIEIVSGTPAEDWKLERAEESGDFVLANAKPSEKLDPNKVASMKGAFSNPQFDDVFTGDSAKEQKTGSTTFKIVTFDDFRYEVAVGEKNDLNEMPLTLKVTAELPKERKKGEEESEEEAKKLDEEFKARAETLQKKLDLEKSLEGKVFKVRSFVVDSITKKRSELMEEKPAAEAGTEEVAPGVSLPGLPPATAPAPAEASVSEPAPTPQTPAPAPAPAPAPETPAPETPAPAPQAPAPAVAPAEAAKSSAVPDPPAPEEPKTSEAPAPAPAPAN